MKRMVMAFAAIAVAMIATVGVVRVTNDPAAPQERVAHNSAAPKGRDHVNDTSRNLSNKQLADQSKKQAEQMKVAQAHLIREARAYVARLEKKQAHHP
jgi:hypothetical protein